MNHAVNTRVTHRILGHRVRIEGVRNRGGRTERLFLGEICIGEITEGEFGLHASTPGGNSCSVLKNNYTRLREWLVKKHQEKTPVKMYITSNGTYFATQDEAKKACREFGSTFEGVDVPIKLRELVGYLNTNMVMTPAPDTLTVGNGSDIGGNNTPPRQPAPTGQSYSDYSVAIDDAWEALPLTRKIQLCTLTMHDVAVAAKRLDMTPPPAIIPGDAGQDLL